MKTLNAPDTISGKEGRAYAKINGNNEELFYAKTIEANVEKSKSEIKAIGKRMNGHKTTGANGSGARTVSRRFVLWTVIWSPSSLRNWTAIPTTPWTKTPTSLSKTSTF